MLQEAPVANAVSSSSSSSVAAVTAPLAHGNTSAQGVTSLTTLDAIGNAPNASAFGEPPSSMAASSAPLTQASAVFTPVTRLLSPRDSVQTQTMQRYEAKTASATGLAIVKPSASAVPPVGSTNAAVSSSNASPENCQRVGYVGRRLAFLRENPSSSNNTNTSNDPASWAICSMPIDLQIAFRRKMMSIFAGQLLLVFGLVLLLGYHLPVLDAWAIVGASVASLLLLGLLYVVRERFPLNWLVLVVFSVVLSVLYDAIGRHIDNARLVAFNCGFAALVVLVMVQTSTHAMRSPRTPAEAVPGAPGGPSALEAQPLAEPRLLPAVQSFLIAFGMVTVVAVALEMALGAHLLVTKSFWRSLVFQFVLMAWVVFDANKMYQVMAPDEYMRGVIYFYIDLVLLLVLLVAIVGLSMVCLAMVSGIDHGGTGNTGCLCDPNCFCYGTINDPGCCDCCCGPTRGRQRRQRRQVHVTDDESSPQPALSSTPGFNTDAGAAHAVNGSGS